MLGVPPACDGASTRIRSNVGSHKGVTEYPAPPNQKSRFSRSYHREKSLQCYKEMIVGFEQYHEPVDELPEETRTFARMIVSLTEEAEAINWYEQRAAVEKDAEAKAIIQSSQEEEFKHFGMDLEFLLRHKPKWRAALKAILFKSGNIVEAGERGEKAEEKA